MLPYCMPKFRSFACTVRPKGGLTDETAAALVTWLEKQDYAFALTELEDEAKHMHLQVWLSVSRDRGEICRSLQRCCERTIPDWDQAQKKVLRQGVKIAYSDWYLDYLAENEGKEAPNEPLINNPPPKTLEYYPTEEEQAAVQAASTAVDKEMHSLATKYKEDADSDALPTLREVAAWLYAQCFHEKSISIPRQQRNRVEKTRILHAYICGAAYTDIGLFLPKTPAKLNAVEHLLSQQRVGNAIHESPASIDP